MFIDTRLYYGTSLALLITMSFHASARPYIAKAFLVCEGGGGGGVRQYWCKQGSNKKGKCIVVLYFALYISPSYYTLVSFLLTPILPYQSYMPPTFSLEWTLL